MERLLFWLMVAQASLPASAADWSTLERYQQTITREEFDRLVSQVYAPADALTNYLKFSTNSVTVFTAPDKSNALFTLRFGSAPSSFILRPSSFVLRH